MQLYAHILDVWGVLDLLNSVPIHVGLDCFSHSITMDAFKPGRYKTTKFYRIEHIPAVSAQIELLLNVP